MTLDDPLSLSGTTVLDKYTIERVVGRGGFAVVYRATHRIWKRPVAIKVFTAVGEVPPEKRAELLESFNREGAILAELSERSAAICQARDVGMLPTAEGELPFMVLEWLEGETLEEVLAAERAAGRPLRSLADAVKLLEPVAHALTLAHDRGIAHRDVKPSNIFVVRDAEPRPGGEPTVKLLDFGIAKVVQDAQKMSAAFAQTSGIPTSFTPGYGAPEQFSRTYGATGPWTDVFALALVVAEVASGKEALAGSDLAEVARKSIDDVLRPTPRALGVATDDAVESIFVRALAVRTENRFQRVGDFWSALRAALELDAPPSIRVDVTGGRGAGDAFARAATALAGDTDALTASGVVPDMPLPGPPQRSPEAIAKRGNRLVWVFGIGLFVTINALGVREYYVRKNAPAVPPVSEVDADAAGVIVTEAVVDASAAPAAAGGLGDPRCPEGMALVPGGLAFLGDDNGPSEERPQHQVQLSAFCIDRFEVTMGEYLRCSNDGACKRASKTNAFEGLTSNDRKIYDPLCNANQPDEKAKHPVNCVTHTDAEFYCHWRKGRLPTEAEWEFAARGSDGRRYPWGDDDPVGGHGHLNACGPECVAWGAARGLKFTAMYDQSDEFPHTAPVGSFPGGRTQFGLEDMVGNVWEWVADRWGPYQATAVGEPQKDPRGPAGGDERVIRGGGWNSQRVEWAHPSYRYFASPDQRSYGIGFRCMTAPTDSGKP